MIDVPVEVKDALREGTYKKNYRFVVLEEDGTASDIGTIDNDNLVSESVSIDERMCSGDTLKFGLCEGSSLEFQYFDKPNITGKRVQTFVDVDFDERVEAELITSIKHTGNIYWSEEYRIKLPGHYVVSERNNLLRYVVINSRTDPENVSFTEQADHLMVAEFDVSESDLAGNVYTIILAAYGDGETANLRRAKIVTHSIPMGFFDVKKCSRQASTGIIKATCYNKLQSEYLDAKANDILIDVAAHNDRYSSLTLDKLLEGTLGAYAIEKTFDPAQCTSEIIVAAVVTTDMQTRWKLYPVVPDSEFYYVSSVTERFTLTATSADMLYRMRLNASKLTDLYTPYLEPTEGVIVADGSQAVNLNDQAYVRIRESSMNFNSYPYGETGEYSTPNLQNAIQMSFEIRFIDYGNKESDPYDRPTDDELIARYTAIKDSIEFHLEQFLLSGANSEVFTLADVQSWPDVTLRDLQSAAFEISCQFGQLSRITDLFAGVELNHSRLYPSDSLYPATDLYPGGAAASGFRSMYSKLWADEGNVHKWRYLIITYKGLNGDDQEEDFTLQRTINADGTDDYNMSDNWLFRNLVWTAADVGTYADAMVAKMQDVTWFPFEMWCAGLPYLETGDEIEIPLNGESYTSYVLQRQLKGIQNLQDTYINGTLDIF